MKSAGPIHASILVSAFIPACCPQQEKDIVPYLKMGKNGPEYSNKPDGLFLTKPRGGRESEINEANIDAILNQPLKK